MNQRIEKQLIIEEINRLQYRHDFMKEQLIVNIVAGVCKKSILIQKKHIFELKLKIDCLEYKLQDKANEVDKICKETTTEIKKITEIKNTKIEELEKELALLKLLYEKRLHRPKKPLSKYKAEGYIELSEERNKREDWLKLVLFLRINTSIYTTSNHYWPDNGRH